MSILMNMNHSNFPLYFPLRSVGAIYIDIYCIY
nr:MAG TPA: hypothetical protein [Caudoviricetes sp.]